MATNYDERTPLLKSEQVEDLKELFWDNIYQEKCDISLHPKYILYIQKLVESLVSEVVSRILECENYRNFVDTWRKDESIMFSDHFNEEHLLKVGSFYEGTKNCYPDEFDFIYVVSESSFNNRNQIQNLMSTLSDLFHDQIKDIFVEPNLELGKEVACCSLKGLHGPASKLILEFTENSHVGSKTISVDVCIASRLLFENGIPNDFTVYYDEWKGMILETGSVLLLKVYQTDHPKNRTDVKFTITETEQKYVKSKEFEKHRKVYRLLKYILNGNDANEKLRDIIRRQDNRKTLYTRIFVMKQHGPKVVYDLPSFAIKTLMFHHIQKCNMQTKTTADCLYTVLDDLLEMFKVNLDRHTDNWPGPEYSIFSVSTKSMLGQSIEIADDYVSAAIIERNLSSLIKAIKNERLDDSVTESDLQDHIPFAEQNIETAAHVVESRDSKRPWPKPVVALIVIYFAFLFGTLAGYPIVNYLADNACDTNSNTTSNHSTNAQDCCICSDNSSNLTKLNVVTLVFQGNLSKQIGEDNMIEKIITKKKQLSANKVGTDAATQIYRKVVGSTIATECKSEVTGIQLCVYCRWTVESLVVKDNLELGTKNETSCYSLISCKTDGNLVFKLKEKLTICRNITNLDLVESSNQSEHVRLLQTCYETEVGKTRLEIYFEETGDDTDQQSDDCFYYTNVRNITTTSLRLFHLFLFIIPMTLLTRKYVRRLIHYVKMIREHTYNPHIDDSGNIP